MKNSLLLKLAGEDIYINKWRNTSLPGAPIMALHGFTGSGLDFEPIVSSVKSNCCWYAPDFLGHGQSSSPKDLLAYSYDNCVKQLTQILEMLCHTKTILLGYSMGGRVALGLALANPKKVAALVLVGACPGLHSSYDRLSRTNNDNKLAQFIENKGTRCFIDKWQQNPIIQSQKKIDESIYSSMLSRRYANNPIGLANNLRGLGLGQMPNLWPRLKELSCPTFLFSGKNDKKFTDIASQMANLIPGAKHQIIKDAGHACHLENLPEFSKYFAKVLLDLRLKQPVCQL